MENISFNVPSLGCSSCAFKIQDVIRSLSGVKNVSIDLKSQQVHVEYNPLEVQPENIRKAISRTGFDVF